MAGNKQFLKRPCDLEGNERPRRKPNRNYLTEISTSNSQNSPDTAGFVEDLLVSDISTCKTDLPMQPKLAVYPSAQSICGDGRPEATRDTPKGVQSEYNQSFFS